MRRYVRGNIRQNSFDLRWHMRFAFELLLHCSFYQMKDFKAIKLNVKNFLVKYWRYGNDEYPGNDFSFAKILVRS